MELRQTRVDEWVNMSIDFFRRHASTIAGLTSVVSVVWDF